MCFVRTGGVRVRYTTSSLRIRDANCAACTKLQDSVAIRVQSASVLDDPRWYLTLQSHGRLSCFETLLSLQAVSPELHATKIQVC